MFGDLNSNSEVEGNAFIGGTLSGSSSNYCIKCNGGGSDFVPFDGVGLKVVGDIEGNPKQVNNGSNLEYGGNVSAIVNMNGGGARTQNSDLAAEMQAFQTYAIELSAQLAGLSPNGTVELPGSQPGRATFKSSGDALTVFNVDGDALFSNNTQHGIYFNALGSEETVVINVSGTDITQKSTNHIQGLFQDNDFKQKVIWNFFEATNLEFKTQFHGSVLAPFAHLKNNTNIEGTVVVNSFEQRGEVHLPVFKGELPKSDPQEVPEPTTVLGMMMTLGLAATLKRQQRTA